MKTNNNQKIVIDTLITHINNWKTTNDINSPSHDSYNEEWYFGLEHELRDSIECSFINIEQYLVNLLSEIRKIK